MKVFESTAAWRQWRAGAGQTLGFVPTMGALHPGHLALVQQSKQDNGLTAVSIYVNPTQFDRADDLEKYPRVQQADLQLLEQAGVNAVLLPGYEDLYPDQYRYRVSESNLSQRFCGAHRPGHFDGVLTVVMKLLNLVRPHRAYFGQKDFQQLELIRGMAEAFLMDVEIVACPTVRETDGLALSSRNQRLDTRHRAVAAGLYRSLRTASSSNEACQQLEQQGFVVDYVEEFAGRRLAAASLGDVRLIDNVAIEEIQKP